MKFKHFLVLTVVFALVALGTSCSKPSENKIIGKWQIVSVQERSSADPEWVIETPDASDVSIVEFRKDGTYVTYYNGELDENGTWSFDKENQKLLIRNLSFDILKCTSKEMVLSTKMTFGESWIEEQATFKKVK